MTRAAKKSIKMFSYLVALSVGVILVFFGIQAKGDSLTIDENPNLLVDVASADNTTGGGGDSNPWSGGRNNPWTGDGDGDDADDSI